MDKNSEQGTVAQFCGDRYQNSGLVHMGEDDYGQYMHVKDPVVLAALVAFCSGNHHRVLLRGMLPEFPQILPIALSRSRQFLRRRGKTLVRLQMCPEKTERSALWNTMGPGEPGGSPTTLWNQDPVARRSPEPPYRDLVRHAHARHRRLVTSRGQAEHGRTWMDLPVCKQPRRAAAVDGRRPLRRPLVATCQTARAARSVSCHAMRHEERRRPLSTGCMHI